MSDSAGWGGWTTAQTRNSSTSSTLRNTWQSYNYNCHNTSREQGSCKQHNSEDTTVATQRMPTRAVGAGARALGALSVHLHKSQRYMANIGFERNRSRPHLLQQAYTDITRQGHRFRV
jgi:hypothetical protein